MTGASRGAQAPRLAALDGLRGAAAIAVVAFHVYATTWPGLERVDAPPLVRFALSEAGILAVDAFFVLSGFLVLGPLLLGAAGLRARPSLRRFAASRALRILPAWWLALAVTAVVSNREVLGSPLDVALLVTLQHSLDPHLLRSVIGPAWTLHIEVWFYALAPPVALGLARLARAVPSHRRATAVLVGVVLLAAASLALQAWWLADARRPSPDLRVASYTAPLWLDRFLLGGAAAVLVEALRCRGRRTRPDALAVAGLVLGAVALQVLRPHGDLVARPAVVLGLALLVAGLAERSRLARPLAWRPLVLVGEVSYGLYLWHLPLLHALVRLGLVHRDAPWETAPALVAVGGGALLLGWLSHVTVERRALALLPVLAPRRRPGFPAAGSRASRDVHETPADRAARAA